MRLLHGDCQEWFWADVEVRVEPHELNVQVRVDNGEWETVADLEQLLTPAFREDRAVLLLLLRLRERCGSLDKEEA